MKIYEVKSFAKINLALHVTGKVANLHKIESVVNFIDLHDKIFIKKIDSNKHDISFIGNFSKNIKKDNTVSKLFKVLEDKKILNNKKFQIKIKKKKIIQISKLIGSDIILGINPKSAILSSNGIVKKFSKTSRFNILLIRPNFGCSTKKIYSGVKDFSKPIMNNPRKNMMNLKSLLKYKNDLEKIAFTKYPKLKILKSFLENYWCNISKTI